MFRPRDSFDQRLLDCALKVTPEPAEIRWIHDVFGNCVTLVNFACTCETLEFETIIRLDHTPENAPDFRIEDYALNHPFSYAEDEISDLAAYIRRQHPGGGEVENWLVKFLPQGVSLPTGHLLMTLNEAIAESFSYRRRTVRNPNTLRDTKASTRHLPRFRAAHDGGSTVTRLCGALRHRLCLCSNP